jgi:hypothetical protein
MRKDMTQAEFDTACERRSFVPQPFGGYYKLGESTTRVSIYNAGPTRREQLAYLIREQSLLDRKAIA